ncbi:MAG: hypothetical protein LBJ67_13945 [Planctomycetaceae bacterium]|jgi:hypothetical protein|nr:hypothetical protein [Planctomycetaceae bacterium]
MMKLKKTLFLCLLSLTFVVSGCGPKQPYPIVPVEGTASWQGKTLPKNFIIVFQPEDGSPESKGYLKRDDGSFQMLHTPQFDGVRTGASKVYVLWGLQGTEPVPKEYKDLIAKYSTPQTGIQVQVTKKDLNMKIDFP